ncbi:MAG: hypothetical protein JKY37_28820 [Nannocystaceae bacterium]|nr:hypothetical protein [Nannocystaceae bacterium]
MTTLDSRILSPRALGALAGLCVAVGGPATALAAPADYYDATEMEAAIDLLDGAAGGRVTVHTIGMTPNGHKTRAIHLSALGPGGVQPDDTGDKPALLVECGMHAREWAGPQNCLLFVQGFVLATLFHPSRVDDILANADIWVLPMVNPDGRDMDDTSGGDPTNFWTSTIFHPATSSDTAGWRDNAQTVDCPAAPGGNGAGIDLNRAFSKGWNSGQSNCLHNQFHGEWPFQAKEARILRRFVNNRMISMSLSVHSFRPCVGAQNGGSGVPQTFQSIWNGAVADPNMQLNYAPGTCSGAGVGQFTAWMARPSDTGFERDHSTKRGAVSMLLELAPNGASYNDPVTLSPYRNALGDGSNPFHPSDDNYLRTVARPFFKSLMYLAEQARSPWCAIDPLTLAPDPSCTQDFGLTGSKIANCEDCVGKMIFKTAGGESYERMPAGKRRVVYRVQNFDSSSAGTVQVTVVISSRPAGSGAYSTDLVNTDVYSLASTAGDTGSVPFAFTAGRDYMVSINTWAISFPGSSDTNGDNGHHLFRFETY